MRLFYILSALIFFTSCARLDGMLYNPYNDIEEYKFDDFIVDHESFFQLDESYKIEDSLINLFTLSSGLEEIYAVYVGEIDNISTDTIILYCHGNTGHMDSYWQRTKLLANVGGTNNYGVMTFDYQGYGLSSGTPSEAGMYDDADACINWLKDQGLTDDRLIIYGFSMGSAATCELTAHPRTLTPSKLILEAPFASAAVMIADGSLLDMPSSYLTNLEIDNAEEIKEIEQPFLWLHGTADDFIQLPTHGQLIYDNYQGSYKKSIIVEGGEHSTVPQTYGFEAYKTDLLNFIRR